MSAPPSREGYPTTQSSESTSLPGRHDERSTSCPRPEHRGRMLRTTGSQEDTPLSARRFQARTGDRNRLTKRPGVFQRRRARHAQAARAPGGRRGAPAVRSVARAVESIGSWPDPTCLKRVPKLSASPCSGELMESADFRMEEARSLRAVFPPRSLSLAKQTKRPRADSTLGGTKPVPTLPSFRRWPPPAATTAREPSPLPPLRRPSTGHRRSSRSGARPAPRAWVTHEGDHPSE